MNKIDQIFKKSLNLNDFSKAYFDYLGLVLSKISLDEIKSFVELILISKQREGVWKRWKPMIGGQALI